MSIDNYVRISFVSFDNIHPSHNNTLTKYFKSNEANIRLQKKVYVFIRIHIFIHFVEYASPGYFTFIYHRHSKINILYHIPSLNYLQTFASSDLRDILPLYIKTKLIVHF